MPLLTCVQPEPADYVGTREATGGAREAEDGGAGEESPAAGTHVTLAHTAQPGSTHTHKHARKTRTCLQVAAGQEGAGQAGPEGSGGDCGQLHFILIQFFSI